MQKQLLHYAKTMLNSYYVYSKAPPSCGDWLQQRSHRSWLNKAAMLIFCRAQIERRAQL
jgi:hypothetical protein